MDLNTVTNVVALKERTDLAKWKPGSAWLAGGTWLFSEPQIRVDTLLDLASLNWPPIVVDERSVQIAATCTFAQLMAFAPPPELFTLGLIEPCCRALLGSFKVWNMATVGGNICLALPAGPMTAFTIALDGSGIIWTASGSERRIAIADLVVGPSRNSLQPGEILRSIELPLDGLRRRFAHRRASLSTGGRSAAFLIGTRDQDTLSLTITASTPRPVRLAFTSPPAAQELRAALDDAIPLSGYYDDVHGRPAWRQRLTRMLAEEIREELLES